MNVTERSVSFEFATARPQSLSKRLLVDRFGMKFHHDTKELQEYALVIIKGGPRLNEPKATEPNSNDPQVQQLVKMGSGSLDANDIPISRLIEALSLRLGTAIADKTNLKGRYDIILRWTPQLDSSPMPINPENHQNAIAPSNDSAPGFFTAIKEQLGLELKSEKLRVDVIVIDQIEPPSPN